MKNSDMVHVSFSGASKTGRKLVRDYKYSCCDHRQTLRLIYRCHSNFRLNNVLEACGAVLAPSLMLLILTPRSIVMVILLSKICANSLPSHPLLRNTTNPLFCRRWFVERSHVKTNTVFFTSCVVNKFLFFVHVQQHLVVCQPQRRLSHYVRRVVRLL